VNLANSSGALPFLPEKAGSLELVFAAGLARHWTGSARAKDSDKNHSNQQSLTLEEIVVAAAASAVLEQRSDASVINIVTKTSNRQKCCEV